MKILIPSRSRHKTMSTPFQFPEWLMKDVIVYTAVEQKADYVAANPDLNIRSVSTMNDLLGRKLELMSQDVDDELVMLCDDDFVFFRRIDPFEPQLRKMEDEDWNDLMEQIEGLFAENPNLYGVGVSMRQGNNRLEPEGNPNSRLNGCIIYRRKVFLSVEHDRTNPMNDFDVNLQLLRAGWDNLLIAEFCYNQGGTNAPGGSSDYRNLETQAAAAEFLADEHHPFVRTRIKQNKTGDESLRERKEVTVYWKKARASAVKSSTPCGECGSEHVYSGSSGLIDTCHECGGERA